MKKFILFLLLSPMFLKAQAFYDSRSDLDSFSSKALNIIFLNITNTYFDKETFFYMEEFQMSDSSAREVMDLFSNSSLYCNVAKNKRDYRVIVKETGIKFSRKFDSHVIGYCECLTENLNIFLWNFDDGVAMGILTTPTNLN
jgi:hypothetical protein